MIKLCTRCIYPDTKPNLFFDDEGVCSACRSFETRASVDWNERRAEFQEITARYRSKDGRNYDCIVPVSGGKDSTYQVVRLLELALNPLCVTATTDSLSELGRRNIENIKRLGVDYLEMSTNPVVRRKINRRCLAEIGDISWPEHVAIFTIPIRFATKLGIPLVIWGENGQNEYGGPAAAAEDNTMDRRWLEEFGGLLGLRVSDMQGVDGITARDLIPYTYPSEAELKKTGVTALFLGYFIPWDGFQNAVIAQANGFETFATMVEGSLADYENLDNYQTGIHDYFKYLKFGFGRATDIACNHIRRGRLRRDDALRMVEKRDGVFPWTYLGRPIEEILGEIDMTLDEFLVICDRFTNRNIFVTDNRGDVIRDDDGNVLKIA